MFNLIKADLFKLLKDKPFKVILIILALVNLFVMGIFVLAINILNGPMPGADIYSMQAFTLLQIFDVSILGLFVVLSTSLFTGKDFSQNTLRPKITSGNSRTKIYISMFVVNLVIGFIAFFITTIEGILLALMFYGKIANFGAIIANIALCIPLYICFIAVATLISVATKSQTLGILFNILVVVVLVQVISLALNLLSVFIPDNNFIETIFSIIPYSQINFITSGQLLSHFLKIEGATIPAFFVAKLIISPIILSAIAGVCGWVAFKNADIK